MNFADVEKVLVQNLTFSNKASSWRKIGKGLNLFGLCQNPNCEAFNKEVIFKVGIIY